MRYAAAISWTVAARIRAACHAFRRPHLLFGAETRERAAESGWLRGFGDGYHAGIREATRTIRQLTGPGR